MHPLQEFEQSHLKKNLPAFKSGDTVKVHCKIKEGDKERIQVFEGIVISKHNAGASSSFTVRKISYGVGVERIFPLHAAFIDKVEVMSIGNVRRSRLYYLRELSGKKARISAVDTRRKGEIVIPQEGEVESETMAATSVTPPETKPTEKPTEESKEKSGKSGKGKKESTTPESKKK
jgi:large subunit ribosomal protein L19